MATMNVNIRNGSTHYATGKKMPKRRGFNRSPRSPSDVLVSVSKAADLLRESGESYPSGLPCMTVGEACKKADISPNQFYDYFESARQVFDYKQGCVPRKRWGNDVRDPKFMEMYYVGPVVVAKKGSKKKVTPTIKGSQKVTLTLEQLAAIIAA